MLLTNWRKKVGSLIFHDCKKRIVNLPKVISSHIILERVVKSGLDIGMGNMNIS